MKKWDGSGYPNQLSGKDIPESSRIVAIVDVFDALVCKRPYKDPWSIEESLNEMRHSAGSHFDPDLFELFIQEMPRIIEIKDQWSDMVTNWKKEA